jgi:glucose dehydrogenase
VIYVVTGADDVFAMSVQTGQILWKYKANLDGAISTPVVAGRAGRCFGGRAEFMYVS